LEVEKKDKELLIRAFTFYYEKEVWTTMAKNDNSEASDEIGYT
jgi:hypothetical protein